MKVHDRPPCPHCGRPMPSGSAWLMAREAKGMSIREAAAASGLSASTVNRADHGEELMASAAVALARAYGVTVEAMIPEVGKVRADRRGGSRPGGGRPVDPATALRMAEVLQRRDQGQTFDAIGRALGVTRQRAEQLARKGREVLAADG